MSSGTLSAAGKSGANAGATVCGPGDQCVVRLAVFLGAIAQLHEMAALRSRELSLAKIAIWLEISQMKVHRILARHNGQVRC